MWYLPVLGVRSKFQQVLADDGRLGDEGVDFLQDAAGQPGIARARFVGDDVVEEEAGPADLLLVEMPYDRVVAGGEEGHPVFEDGEVGLLPGHPPRGPTPRQGIDRIDQRVDIQWRIGRRSVIMLRRPRKQERRILPRKREDADLVSASRQRLGQEVHKMGDAPPMRVRRADQDEFHPGTVGVGRAGFKR